MSRIRSIKPEFFSSLDVVCLTERARLMFIGLWTYADDSGRGLDEPRLIKAALFPLDDGITVKVINRLMGELAGKGRIVRYHDPDGLPLFEITKWSKHQRIDRPSPSKYRGAFDDISTNGHGHIDEDS